MATNAGRRKQEKPEKSGAGASALPTFVSCELSAGEREFVKAHVGALVDLMDSVDTLVREGYKFSFSYDDRSDAVLVVMTAGRTAGPNNGLALSARGPGIDSALSVLFYKHFQMLDGIWPKPSDRTRFDSWS